MNHAFSKIWLYIVLVILIAGGILAWQYLRVPTEVVEIPEEEVTEVSEEIIPEVSPPEEVKIEKPPVEDKLLTVQDILRNAAEAYKQWNEFYVVYSSSLIMSADDFSEETELVNIREKEGEKLRQEVYKGSIYGEGVEMRMVGLLEGTTYHFSDGRVVSCLGKEQFCKGYPESTLESVGVILSLFGNEVEHLQRLLLLRIGLEPIIELSYDGTREITYDFTILQNRKEFEEGVQPIKKTVVCNMVRVEFNMKALTDFVDIKGNQPYGDINPELSSFKGEICFDRETGLASYGKMDILQVSLTGKRAHMKTQMELETFVNFHKEPEGLIFPEEVLKY